MKQTNIPKVIHYCWFSGDSKPVVMQECIKSWQRVMPDYRIQCWDASTLDLNVPFLRQAYEHRNWAFVTDYMRFYILYTEGGIYLDSDVEVFRRFDSFLSNSLFSGIEYEEALFQEIGLSIVDNKGALLDRTPRVRSIGVAIEAAILGAVKGHPYAKACLDFYQSRPFKDAEGHLFRTECPVVMASLAEPYGFVYKNGLQQLKDGICLYPYPTFTYGEGEVVPAAYARHWRNGSWRDKTEMSRVYKYLQRFHLLKLYYLLERTPCLYHFYRWVSHQLNKK